jgi:hypothetical protein
VKFHKQQIQWTRYKPGLIFVYGTLPRATDLIRCALKYNYERHIGGLFMIKKLLGKWGQSGSEMNIDSYKSLLTFILTLE